MRERLTEPFNKYPYPACQVPAMRVEQGDGHRAGGKLGQDFDQFFFFQGL